jgi:hypothetical protein
MHAVYPIFHVSMLRPSTPNSIPNHIQPPPPVMINKEPEYGISEISAWKSGHRTEKKTVTKLDCDLSGPQITKTDKNHNCSLVFGPLWIQNFEDQAKTSLNSQRPVFQALVALSLRGQT